MAHGDSTTYIRTRYGKFWPLDPRPQDIDVRDIAYSLAGQYRYVGYSRLTVAQHCVVGSYFIDPAVVAICFQDNRLRLTFLFHDADEALGLPDLARPVKHDRRLKAYVKFGENLQKCVSKKFDLLYPFPPIIHEIDNAMFRTEQKILFGRELRKGERLLNLTIDQSRLWPPDEAEHRFLARYEELTGERVRAVQPHKLFGNVPAPDPALLAVLKSPAQAAASIITAPLTDRPPRSFTASEYARENGVGIEAAHKQINKLRESSKVRSVKFKWQRSDGRVQLMSGWQLVDEEGI